MKKKIELELVDLSDYIAHSSWYVNTYYLHWFELMRYHKDKYVWFGVGPWTSHLMDWRGCNFWHGRLPKSPVFATPKAAVDWLYYQVENGVYKDKMELNGHHSGDADCKSCNRNKDEDDIFGRRETGCDVSVTDIIGPARLRVSRRKLLKKHERDFI